MAWTVTDQAVSSLSNFTLGIVVAREVSTPEFGAFGIAFISYLLIVGITRSLCTDALVIRYSDAGTPGRRQAAKEATGAALALAFPMAAVCAAAGLVLGGPLRAPLLALAVCVPGLATQDAMRFAFFALGTPAKAAANDVVWLLGQVAAFAAVFSLGEPAPATLLLAWGLAATLAAVLSPLQARLAPSPQRGLVWTRAHFDLGGRYLLDFFAVIGSAQITIYGLGAVAGLAATGAFRAAQLLLGPLNTLFLGAISAAVPEGVRMTTSSGEDVRPMCRRLALVLTGLALAWVLALVLVPDWVGTAILGESWDAARPLLPVLGVATAAIGVLSAADSGLRSLANAPRSLRARLGMLPLTVGGGLGGALVAGAWGSAVGLLVANCVGSGIFWYQFSRAADERDALASVAAAPVH